MRLALRLLALSAMLTASAQALIAQRPEQPPAAPDTIGLARVPCTYATCALRIRSTFWHESLVRGEQAEVVARLDWPSSPHIEHVFEGSQPAVAHAARYARAERVNRVLGLTGAVAFGLGVVEDRAWNGLTISGLALLVAGLRYDWLAHRSLSEAVSSYNAELPDGPPRR